MQRVNMVSWAMYVCHSDVILAQLNHDGVDLNIQNNEGKTAQDRARDNDNDNVARFLQEHIRVEG